MVFRPGLSACRLRQKMVRPSKHDSLVNSRSNQVGTAGLGAVRARVPRRGRQASLASRKPVEKAEALQAFSLWSGKRSLELDVGGHQHRTWKHVMWMWGMQSEVTGYSFRMHLWAFGYIPPAYLHVFVQLQIAAQGDCHVILACNLHDKQPVDGTPPLTNQLASCVRCRTKQHMSQRVHLGLVPFILSSYRRMM